MKKLTSSILLATLVLAVALSGCGGGSGGGGDKSSNADLSALTVSSGTLVPQFNPSITSYTVSVVNGVESVSITGTKADVNASVTGSVTLSNLKEGEAQTASIIVTAQNGATKTYTVAVTRTGTSTKAITSFSFENPAVTGVINEANHTIAVTVPYGTDVKALTSVIEQVTKAGPGLAGLIASILFIAVAAWSISKSPDADTRKCSIAAGTAITLSDGKLSGAVPVTCSTGPKDQQ